MRICLKKSIKIDKKTLQKHQEGVLLAVLWTDGGNFTYLIDFNKEGTHTIDAGECDILNCR